MSVPVGLPFEYTTRARMTEGLSGVELARALEERDRQLEDYLAAATRGWREVVSGSVSGAANITVQIPEGVYSALRLTARGNLSSNSSLLLILNDDTAANRYRTTRRVFAGSYSQTPGELNTASVLGPWSTTGGNALDLLIDQIKTSNFVVWRGQVIRRANNTVAADHVMTSFDGRVNGGAILVNEVRVQGFGVNITADYRVEGYRS